MRGKSQLNVACSNVSFEFILDHLLWITYSNSKFHASLLGIDIIGSINNDYTPTLNDIKSNHLSYLQLLIYLKNRDKTRKMRQNVFQRLR